MTGEILILPSPRAYESLVSIWSFAHMIFISTSPTRPNVTIGLVIQIIDIYLISLSNTHNIKQPYSICDMDK